MKCVETQIKKDVNEFMFNQYKKGRVLNHSVGMRYIKVFLCIDSNEASYSSEKANWDKYFPLVVNKEIAEQKGIEVTVHARSNNYPLQIKLEPETVN